MENPGYKKFIQKLKDELINSRKIENNLEKVKQSGDQINAQCPFHEDKQASFSYSIPKGKWYCHAGCGSGDVIDFYYKLWNDAHLSFTINRIADELKIKYEPEEYYKLNSNLADQFVKNMRSDPKKEKKYILSILTEKGLIDETLHKNKIGIYLDELEQCARISIPVFDQNNNLRQIRLYSPMHEPKIKNYTQNHFKNKNQLFGLPNLLKSKSDQVIICEGEWDCLLLQQLGYTAVSSTGGASYFKTDWGKYFQNKKVIICYDCDEAGIEGAQKKVLPVLLTQKIKSIKNIVLPLTGKKGDNDVSDFFLKHKKTKEDFDKLIKEAQIITLEKVQTEVKNESDFIFIQGNECELMKYLIVKYKREFLKKINGQLYFYNSAKGWYEQLTNAKICQDLVELNNQPFGPKNKLLSISSYNQKGARKLLIDQIDEEKKENQFTIGYVAFKNYVMKCDGFSYPNGIPHSPEMPITWGFEFDYTANYNCPRWEKFLQEFFAKNEEPEKCIALVQQFAGACLFGLATYYKKALLFCGGGEEGKSQFIEVLTNIFPKHLRAAVEPQQMENDYHRFKLANSLINAVSETSSQKIIKATALKSIISGDTISAREIRESPIDIKPKAGHIFSLNKLPAVMDVSHGFWRRWIPIQCKSEITKREREIGMQLLNPKYYNEYEGIVCWAVDGMQRLVDNNGFIKLNESLNLKDEWQQESNSVLSFIKEWCKPIDEKTSWTSGKILWDAYKNWCQEAGYQSGNKGNFGRNLTALKIDKKKSDSLIFRKIQLKTEMEKKDELPFN